jgi:predicted hydrocarbon binding protein
MNRDQDTNTKKDVLEQFNDISISAYGLELIRSSLLPSLLGKEHDGILYWAGKDLARKFPLNTIEEIIVFFQKASWGTLELVKETNKDILFHLSSPMISKRNRCDKTISYQLEAGFLAEQIQQINSYITDAYTSEKKGTNYIVIFKVQWDKKDQVDY